MTESPTSPTSPATILALLAVPLLGCDVDPAARTAGDLPARAASVLANPGPVPPELLPLEAAVERVAVGFGGLEAVSGVRTEDGTGFELRYHEWDEGAGAWSSGRPLPFADPEAADRAPALSPDGSYLLFASDRDSGNPNAFDFNLWVAQREEGPEGEPAGWSDPWLVPAVHSPAWDGSPSIAGDGSLYFSSLREGPARGRSLYMASFEDGMWTAPARIPDPVSSAAEDADPYVAPDQSFLLFASNREGSWNVYAAYREGEGWGEVQRLGDQVNTDGDERAPYLSSAGETLFFVREGDLHSIPAARAGVVRPEPVEPETGEPGRDETGQEEPAR